MKASEIIKEYDMHYDAKTKHYTHTSERTKEVLSELIEINDDACLFMRGDAFYDGVTYTTVVENDLKDCGEEDTTNEILERINEIEIKIKEVELFEEDLKWTSKIEINNHTFIVPKEIRLDVWGVISAYKKKLEKQLKELETKEKKNDA